MLSAPIIWRAVMVDLDNIVQGLSRSGAVGGFAGGLAGTALAGALSGKKGRKMAKSAVKVGALAAVGGLAYTAWQRYRQQRPGGSGTSTGHSPAIGVPLADPYSVERYSHPTIVQGAGAIGQAGRWERLDRNRFADAIDDRNAATNGLLLVRAMIAAAAADGHMNSEEQRRIFREAERLDLSREEKATLFDELRHPMSVDELALQVPNPETALEVYAASLIAVDETRLEARTYLRQLAQALKLPEPLVQSLHVQADSVRRAEAA
jgi:uncharacterized membrane protein YebE (DUF533 family)